MKILFIWSFLDITDQCFPFIEGQASGIGNLTTTFRIERCHVQDDLPFIIQTLNTYTIFE